jgi:hypothetical protein
MYQFEGKKRATAGNEKKSIKIEFKQITFNKLLEINLSTITDFLQFHVCLKTIKPQI